MGITPALWCLGTIGHFLLTARWLTRASHLMTRDERWFQTMVVGTATLSVVLHLLAGTVGLSLPGVLVTLLAGHGLAARATRGLRVGHAVPEADPVTGTLETAAIIILIAVVIQWTVLAVPTTEVSGLDAAHYHVPTAVNLALGASLFDLPPTPHLYPMGSSTLAAWFILPLQTTLLTDLVMVLPFLLLASASAWLFRQLTSLSGLGWSTWVVLALCGTSLFRFASLMSADLLFAAATMAFVAALLAPIGRRQLEPADVWLVAMSLGLLLGAKTTGAIVAVLLGVPAAATLVIQHVRGESLRAIPTRTWVGASLMVVGAGGIWLLRNWWVWGSPVAPNGLTVLGITVFSGTAYEATTYNSVLGDLVETSNYRLWDRALHYIDLRLGSWYLLVISLMALIPLDAMAGWWRGAPRSLLVPRLWSVSVGLSTAAIMMWFLVGAPWTSLEWTKGLSLRYALPYLALLPLIGWAGLFPASLPWYRYAPLAVVGGGVMAFGGLALFSRQPLPMFPPVPTLGAALAALMMIGSRWAVGREMSASAASKVTIVAIVAASFGFGGWVSLADTFAQDIRSAARAGGTRPAGERLYDAALARETRDSLPCDTRGRRFFVTNRFDEPLDLQGARLTNMIFYAGRDVRGASSVRPAMGPCDYIVTERAIMGTDKGAALHGALNTSGTLVEVTTVGDVVLLTHR